MWDSSKSVSGVGAAAEQLCYAGYSIFNIYTPAITWLSDRCSIAALETKKSKCLV